MAAFALSSCNSSGHYAERRAPASGGYVTYASLPPNYAGNAYYYNNRYYAGGRYESGRYTHGGRRYTTRYYHNGQYLYGGDYRQQAPSRAVQPRNRRTSGSAGYVTYTTLPQNYSGNAYYYNNRYYAGGRYESGRYSHGGRTYTTRYYHNGQYLYGGDYRQNAGPGSVQRRSGGTYGSRYPTRTTRASY